MQITAPEVAEKLDEVIMKLNKCCTGEMQFTIILDDSAGNSFIENPFAPKEDSKLTTTLYTRTKEQDEKLGIYMPEDSRKPEEEEPEEGRNYLL